MDKKIIENIKPSNDCMNFNLSASGNEKIKSVIKLPTQLSNNSQVTTRPYNSYSLDKNKLKNKEERFTLLYNNLLNEKNDYKIKILHGNGGIPIQKFSINKSRLPSFDNKSTSSFYINDINKSFKNKNDILKMQRETFLGSTQFNSVVDFKKLHNYKELAEKINKIV